MAIGKVLDELEIKIGYKFQEPQYLENAMTHSSYSNEYKSKGLSIPSKVGAGPELCPLATPTSSP